MKSRVSEVWMIVFVVMLGSSLVQARRSSAWNIPGGTPINVRINENLSSETARTGDPFTGVLAQPLVVNGATLFSRGATVHGQVMSAKKSGRLSDPGELELALTSIGNVNVSSQSYLIKGASHTRSNVGKIGGGAAAGAIVGGIVAGGKGAAIGAGVGAGAGTATAAATGKKPATVESEAILQFVSADSNARISGRGSDGNSYADRPRSHHGEDHDDDGDRRRRHHDDDRDDDDDDDRGRGRDRDHDAGYTFSNHDTDILNSCLSGYNFDSLPPGIQKKLARGGSLPPGQAKKLHVLPDSCNARLPQLPRNIERVIFGDRVIVLEAGTRILDMMTFER